MTLSTRIRKWVPTVALGTAAFTLTTATANAFFPPLPVVSDRVTISPPPPVFVPPTIPAPPPVIPPAPPPPFLPPASPPPVVVPQEIPPRPQVVPEPTTIVSSVIGLSVLGGYMLRRRKKT